MPKTLHPSQFPKQVAIFSKIIAVMELESQSLARSTELTAEQIESITSDTTKSAQEYSEGLCHGLSCLHAIYLMNDEVGSFYGTLKMIEDLSADEIYRNKDLMNFVQSILLLHNFDHTGSILGIGQSSMQLTASTLGFDDVDSVARSWIYNPSTMDLFDYLKSVTKEKAFIGYSIVIHLHGHATTLSVDANNIIHYYDPNHDEILKLHSSDEFELMRLAQAIERSHPPRIGENNEFAYFEIITNKELTIKEKYFAKQKLASLTKIPPKAWESQNAQKIFQLYLNLGIEYLDSQGFDMFFEGLDRITFKKIRKSFQAKIGFIALLLGKTEFIIDNEVFSDSLHEETGDLQVFLSEMVKYAYTCSKEHLADLLSDTHVLGLKVGIDTTHMKVADVCNIRTLLATLPTKLEFTGVDTFYIKGTIRNNNRRVDKLCRSKQIIDIQAFITKPQEWHPLLSEEVEVLLSSAAPSLTQEEISLYNTIQRWTTLDPAYANKGFQLRFPTNESYRAIYNSTGTLSIIPRSDEDGEAPDYYKSLAKVHMSLSKSGAIEGDFAGFVSFLESHPNQFLDSYTDLLIKKPDISETLIPVEYLYEIFFRLTLFSGTTVSVYFSSKEQLYDDIQKANQLNYATNRKTVSSIIIDKKAISVSPEETLMQICQQRALLGCQVYIYDDAVGETHELDFQSIPNESFEAFILSQKEALIIDDDETNFENFLLGMLEMHNPSSVNVELLFDRYDFMFNQLGFQGQLDLTFAFYRHLQNTTSAELSEEIKGKLSVLALRIKDYIDGVSSGIISIEGESTKKIPPKSFDLMFDTSIAVLFSTELFNDEVISQLQESLPSALGFLCQHRHGTSTKKEGFFKNILLLPANYVTASVITHDFYENEFFRNASIAAAMLKKNFSCIDTLLNLFDQNMNKIDEILQPYNNFLEYCVHENKVAEYLELMAAHPETLKSHLLLLSTTTKYGKDLLKQLIYKTAPLTAVQLIKQSNVSDDATLILIDEAFQSGFINHNQVDELLIEFLAQSQAELDDYDDPRVIQSDGFFTLLKARPDVPHMNLNTALHEYFKDAAHDKQTAIFNRLIHENELHLLFDTLGSDKIISCLSILDHTFIDEVFLTHAFQVNSTTIAESCIAVFKALLDTHHSPAMVTDWFVNLASAPESAKYFDPSLWTDPEADSVQKETPHTQVSPTRKKGPAVVHGKHRFVSEATTDTAPEDPPPQLSGGTSPSIK